MEKAEKKSEETAAPVAEKKEKKASVEQRAQWLLDGMPVTVKDEGGRGWLGDVAAFVEDTAPLRKVPKSTPQAEALAELAGGLKRGLSTNGLAMSKHALQVLTGK